MFKCFIGLLEISFNSTAQKLKSFSFYLGHPKISTAAKRFYKNLPGYQKDHSRLYAYYDKNEITMVSVMDSIFSGNNDTRPFYLYLINRMSPMSDGEMTEVICQREMNFVYKNASFFFHFMHDNLTEQKKYLTQWANNLAIWIPQSYCPKKRNDLVNEKGEEEAQNLIDKDTGYCNRAFRDDIMHSLAGENEAILKLADQFFSDLVPSEKKFVTPDTVVVDLDRDQANIIVKKGANFQLRFPEKAGGTGYTWNLVQTPVLCKLINKEMITRQHPAGMTGVPQTTVLTFTTEKKGFEDIRFNFSRIWEKDVPPVETKILHLKVE